MKKVNLEEISNKFGIFQGFSIHSNPDLIETNFKKAMKEACRQVLELAADRAEVDSIETSNDSSGFIHEVNKKSITDTINQVE